jgi:hypothetical protein
MGGGVGGGAGRVGTLGAGVGPGAAGPRANVGNAPSLGPGRVAGPTGTPYRMSQMGRDLDHDFDGGRRFDRGRRHFRDRDRFFFGYGH